MALTLVAVLALVAACSSSSGGHGGAAGSSSGGGSTSSSSSGVQVEANGQTACAVKGGSAWCWGLNDHGQVGNDDHADAEVAHPAKLPLHDVSEVILGGGVNCAIAAGVGYCWGQNAGGAVGNGDANGVDVYRPSKLPLSDVAVAGTDLYCWGAVAEVPGTDDNTIARPVLVPLK